MKVSFITRHAITNYGSLLQTYALQYIIQRMGYEVEVIDYIREDEDYKKIANSLVKKSKTWNKNGLTRAIYCALVSPEYMFMGKKFEKMRKQFLQLTSQKYVNIEELVSEKPVADIYCTGSDQVWGPIGTNEYDPAYFLDFCSKQDKKIAYAGSFGKTEFTEEIKQVYANMLSKYQHIAVREKSAQEILQSLGIPSTQVLDPTLLLTKHEWMELVQIKKNKKIKNDKYVLVYQLHRNDAMDKYAEQFAKKANLPLYRVSPSIHQVTRGGKFIWLPDLGEFLEAINNATYFITDSFHGTAFAINLNTQFIEILPNNNTGTRNQSILEMTGLSNRILKEENDFHFITEMIDFSEVNSIISVEREKSIEILNRILVS